MGKRDKPTKRETGENLQHATEGKERTNKLRKN